MKNLLNPKWLYFINTLPVLILFFLLWGEYSIIRTLLKPDAIELWCAFAVVLGVMALGVLSYTVYLDIKKRQVPAWFAAVLLVTHIAYLYVYAFNSDDMVPWDIPRWMLSGDVLMYAGTFLMPTIAFATLLLMLKLTPDDHEHSTIKNIALTIAVPIVFFLFSLLGIPLYQILPNEFSLHAFIVLIISATVFFLFFLVRLIYIIALKRNLQWTKYQLAWKIPICILLPLIGLAINNGHFLNGFAEVGAGIFGNLGNPWFYILAIINGVLLCLPNLNNKAYRIMLFAGRAMLFPFTFYFFIVFLPFLPVSVIAIVLIGIGFLLLVPLMVFIIHLRELMSDISYLKPILPRMGRAGIFIAGIAVIPLCITFTFMHDKATLTEALAYIYTPNYEKKYDIDAESLNKTLDVVSHHKDRNGNNFGFGSNRQIPYLSSYFQWLVLDNMTLSDRKINLMQKIFIGKSTIPVRPEMTSEERDNVQITNLEHTTKYNANDGSFTSTIDLELTNNEQGLAEYETSIQLPHGCWINDYYLYVGDRKEKGLLAEKKAATWVYDQIRNENRDPGILYYTGANTVAFKVFPFQKNEVRKTGISFIHREPVTLNFDGQAVQLGERISEDSYKSIQMKGVRYVSTAEKSTLKEIERKPYYHFIIDASAGNEKKKEEFARDISELTKAKNNRYTLAGSATTHIPEEKDWKQEWDKQSFAGGFYAEKAIREVLYASYKNPSFSEYPVIVLITDGQPIIEDDFSDLAFTFVESQAYYTVDKDHTVKAHPLNKNGSYPAFITPRAVSWPANGKATHVLHYEKFPEIILTGDSLTVTDSDIQKDKWNSGLLMHAQQMQLALHPELTDDVWLPMVKHSFKSGIMTPHTSYLVVENEAQKAVLKKKQEQVLSGNKSLDLGEDVQRMSEPGLWLMLALTALALLIHKNRRRLAFIRK